MKISIIIPTKDRGKVFERTIVEVLKAVENIQAEIIVVNDSKTSQPLIPTNNGIIRLINNPKNGVASARNLGARTAISDILLFMDDDMLISEENILDGLKLQHEFSNACININWIYQEELLKKIDKTQFGRFLIKYGFTSLKGWYNDDSWSDDSIFESSGITSQFLLVPKKVFVEVGGYDETFPHAGAEDTDFGKRLAKAGIKFYIDPSCIAFHNETDRIEIKPWLERKKRGGETRKIAVKKGHIELEIKHNIFKSSIYKLITPLKGGLLLLQKLVPNYIFFDVIYFKITKILLGIYSFDGYRKH